MAPTGAALVTVGIKAVVLTHSRKLGIHDIIRVDTDIGVFDFGLSNVVGFVPCW